MSFSIVGLHSEIINNLLNVLAAPVEFTDEEGYGKYLDLHECYEKYINLKGIEVRNSNVTTTTDTIDH